MKILECVPNFSEGQNRQTIDAIADALQRVSGVRLLDICTDADHNRTVFTFVGSPDGIEKAAAAACDRALALIDMRAQRGVHPRIGAVDVVPFIPLKNAVMADAVETARRFGRAFAQRNGLPVYFYGEAALIEEHRELPHIRRGGYEGLEKRMKDPDWAPDAGPSVLNERSGATAVGARDFLVAYNVNLASADLGAARKIAETIRYSSGGMKHVKAIGVPLKSRGIVQVSMNLTNFRETPVKEVFDRVRSEAETLGVQVLESELVGLIPEEALKGVTPQYLMLKDFSDDRILERHLQAIGAGREA
ncbi:MAG: glutamate formimidoyltransferase [Syntrophales bacterium]|nr:glutamate formimidoyltransferase [Syntrophales bacterium]